MAFFARLSAASRPAWHRSFHSTRAMLATNPSLRIIEQVTKNAGPKGEASSTSSFVDAVTTGSSDVLDPVFEYSSHFSSPLPARYAKLHKLAEQEYPGTSSKSISPLQAQLFKMLMRTTRANRVLELGCFMGYSAMALADGMGPHGVVYTCEKDEKAANLARRVFEEHHYTRQEQDDHSKYKVARIELLEGNAMDSLKALAENNMEFDAIFIDADKGNYINYYEFILGNNMLSRNGFILADNVLFRGLVINSETASSEMPFFTTSSSSSASHSSHASSPKLEEYIEKKIEKIEKAQEKEGGVTKLSKEEKKLANAQKTADQVHRFNLHVLNDGRVEVALLPLFDGLSIIRRIQ